MHGEPIQAIQSGVQLLVSTLRQDPQALEMAYLSVITFDTEARQVVPLTALSVFQEPSLTATGTTALGGALALAARCAEQDVRKSTAEARGDWKPLMFVFTDGQPTDDFESGLRAMKAYKWGLTVAVGPDGVDEAALQRIAETVLLLKDASSETIRKFFKWVSASISAASASIGATGAIGGAQVLPPPPAEILLPV